MVLSSCLLDLIVCITCFTRQGHVNSVSNIYVKLMVNFLKRVTKIFVLILLLNNLNRKKCIFLSIYYRNSTSKCSCVGVDIS